MNSIDRILRRNVMEATGWTDWPPEGATRDELLASLEAYLALERRKEEQRRREHEVAMAEWRRTIKDRLLALIPRLEAGEDLEYGPMAYGGIWRELRPPYFRENDLARIRAERREALEAFPNVPIPMSVRNFLFMVPKSYRTEALSSVIKSLQHELP